MYSFVETHKGLRCQSGFTLIELMIALVLGLLVVLGATQLFLTSSQSFRSIEDINKQQEVVSYVSSVIGYEVRIARGGTGPVGAGGNIVDESNRLKIEFDFKSEYMPYCPAGSDHMFGVEYFIDIEDSSLVMQANCDGVKQGEQEVINGISDIQFTTEKIGVYVDVALTLEPSGTPPSSETIAMRFTRHSSEALQ